MGKEHIIAAIDVGSSKIVSLIAEVTDERIQVIGVSTLPSRGIKKGVVVDIDDSVEVISECIDAAERMAGVDISRVWLSVNGNHISSVNSQGVVAVSSPDGEISDSDVDRVTEAARAISIPSSREIIHVLPRTFIVDSQEGIDDPIGMSGVRLQVETHIVSGATTSIRNLVKCVQQVGLDVENLVFTGLASSESLLTETEKELGVVLVDIGGGTTNVVVYSDGSPVSSSVLKIGGKNVTSDIAIGLRIPLEDAEEVKKYISTGIKEPVTSEERSEEVSNEVDLSSLGLKDLQHVEKDFIENGIVKPRLEEMAEEIAQQIKKSGYDGLTPAGIVVGGGAAQTVGMVEVLSKMLKLPARMAEPKGVSGLIDEVQGPEFAGSIGTVLYAAHNGHSTGVISGGFKIPSFGIGEMFSKFVSFIKGFMP